MMQRIAHPAAPQSRYGLQLYRNVGGRFQGVRVPGLSGVHGMVRAVPAEFDLVGYPDLLLACGGLDNFRWEPSLVLRNDRGNSFQIAAWLALEVVFRSLLRDVYKVQASAPP